MIADSPALRELLGVLLPGIQIRSSPSPSGQRVVYFCTFVAPTSPAGLEKHGQVVVKVSEGVSTTQIAYLEKEIEILNSLKSRHYPVLIWNGAFTEDPRTADRLSNRLFVTIEECIESQPLSEATARYRDAKSVLLLLRDLIDALEPLWTHKLKLVHRDLKPDNILIRTGGEVAIIDLGIVREEGAKGVTLSFFPYGPCTPHYASPEQARNDKRNITFKSDFFSLGAIAYQLLSGRLPFGSADADNGLVLENVISHEPPSLFSLGKCPPSMSDLIMKMMQKEPYRRHRTIELLKADIASTSSQI